MATTVVPCSYCSRYKGSPILASGRDKGQEHGAIPRAGTIVLLPYDKCLQCKYTVYWYTVIQSRFAMCLLKFTNLYVLHHMAFFAARPLKMPAAMAVPDWGGGVRWLQVDTFTTRQYSPLAAMQKAVAAIQVVHFRCMEHKGRACQSHRW
jgi:hypothetical protein